MHNHLHCPTHFEEKRGIPPSAGFWKNYNLSLPHFPPLMLVREVAEEELALCPCGVQSVHQSNRKTALMITLFLGTTVLELGGTFKTTNIWIPSAKPLIDAHSASVWALPAVILILWRGNSLLVWKDLS